MTPCTCGPPACVTMLVSFEKSIRRWNDRSSISVRSARKFQGWRSKCRFPLVLHSGQLRGAPPTSATTPTVGRYMHHRSWLVRSPSPPPAPSPSATARADTTRGFCRFRTTCGVKTAGDDASPYVSALKRWYVVESPRASPGVSSSNAPQISSIVAVHSSGRSTPRKTTYPSRWKNSSAAASCPSSSPQGNAAAKPSSSRAREVGCGYVARARPAASTAAWLGVPCALFSRASSLAW
mmetsp:Transcript_45174/g.143825  ORF Transcript_45174/g.143825 Transcript_45174/m.143825 type:complete len:237 (-) Transcript_45174:349-1059(-)